MSGFRGKLAVNPLAYWMSGTETARTRGVVERAFRDSARAGFTAVKADVLDGMTTAEYSAWLSDLGVSPALSMFMSTFDRTTPVEMDVEAARRYAEQQSTLGLTETMICAIFVPERVATPAIGAQSDEARLGQVIDDLGAVCDALVSGGIRPLLHPHVGGWIETEPEVERVLASIGTDQLGFGPDTGHLFWAGMDPAAMIARHSERVGGLHLKDVLPQALHSAEGIDYRRRTASRQVWAEPGLGAVDFDAVFAALPEKFSGDCVVEVDVPTVADPFDSLQLSRKWARAYFPDIDDAA